MATIPSAALSSVQEELSGLSLKRVDYIAGCLASTLSPLYGEITNQINALGKFKNTLCLCIQYWYVKSVMKNNGKCDHENFMSNVLKAAINFRSGSETANAAALVPVPPSPPSPDADL